MSEELNPLETLRATINTDARDWAENPADALIYAIVIGWGKESERVAKQHNWGMETISRLRQLRIKFHELESRVRWRCQQC